MKRFFLISMLFLTGCMQPAAGESALVAPTVLSTPGAVGLASATASPVPSPTATVFVPVCYVVTAAESLHVRADHDYQSAVVGYLYHGDLVAAYGSPVAGWLPIMGAVPGWVRGDFVEVVECLK